MEKLNFKERDKAFCSGKPGRWGRVSLSRRSKRLGPRMTPQPLSALIALSDIIDAGMVKTARDAALSKRARKKDAATDAITLSATF